MRGLGFGGLGLAGELMIGLKGLLFVGRRRDDEVEVGFSESCEQVVVIGW